MDVPDHGLGANYSFELIPIETYAPQFIGHDKGDPQFQIFTTQK